MAIMTSSSSSFFYVSAPTSPEKNLLNALLLYSHEPRTDRTTPAGREETESSLDGFEFDTSRRFCYVKDELQEGEVGMAFADELFSGGKVLPLKPPPKMGADKSSGRSLPLGGSFSWRSLWNDDFDPFEAALVNVRKGEYRRGRRVAEECRLKRRARSMSPFRSALLDDPSVRSRPIEKAVWSPMTKIALSRGVEFARRVRLVRSRNNEKEPKRTPNMKKLMPEKSKPVTGKSESSNEPKIDVSARRKGWRRLSKLVKTAMCTTGPSSSCVWAMALKLLGKCRN